MTTYTLDDHAKAKEALELLRSKRSAYSGNNPNKFRADIETAKARLSDIESTLKEAGILQRTPTEQRDSLLDKAFPEARSKEVVEWQGKRFKKIYTPAGKSLSGKTVLKWNTHWEELAD
ncbi:MULTISPECIES: hypothetical protein [Xanthomonas]|uniref:hypothetical protein n=1 Tax=Xanthomonas TaxID=338 RepID=UPI000B051416|nr:MULTISPECIES: hypothetical protein [Xanthomonas]MBB5876168.1 hypothetical protein [Xanthomonas sp. 3498]